MRRWTVVAGIAVVSLAQIGPAARAGGSADWPSYLLDAGHSSYNAAATAIGPSQAASLVPVWHWADPPAVNGGSTTIRSSPTVSNGVVYIGDNDGRLYAIRESDRTVLWSRYLGYQPTRTCPGLGFVSTATVDPDPTTGAPTVYDNGPDGNLYALDAATGALVWTAQVDSPSTTVSDYFAWGSPVVANGKVYLGVASNCDNPLVEGGLVAFDQKTGARLAFWRSMLDDALGGDVWSTPAVLSDGSIVATTGNSADPTETLWADSVVRLDGSTLREMDGWQVPPAQRGGDSDFGGSPTLFTAVLNGVSTPMVGACNKNGDFYAFRQTDLHDGPVWFVNVGTPGAPGAIGEDLCFAAAIWDGSQLIEASGGPAVVGSSSYDGSIRSLNPATGALRWQTGLPGAVVGSPSEDGAGLVAADVYSSSSGAYGVYLLRASDGSVVGYIPASGGMFAQPVFAGNDLLVAGNASIGLTALEAPTPGPPLTSVAPAVLSPGSSATLTITGSEFSGAPSVQITGLGVTATAVQVESPTVLAVTVRAAQTASLGPRDVSVIEPGPVASRCSACLTVLPATTTTVAASATSVVVGTPVTFTAIVGPTDGGGSVTFLADGTSITGCTSRPLLLAGQTGLATCTTSSLTIKTHAITASYGGDPAYVASLGALPGGELVQAPPPPAPPQHMVATVKSTTSIGLSWTGVAGAMKYHVFQGTQAGGPYAQVATMTAPTTSRTMTGLSPGTTYFFVVRANAGYADSANSTEASAATPAIPAAPTGLAGRITALTSIALTWNPVAGATKYSVYIGSVLAATVTGTSRVMSGLEEDARYDFTVKATNGWATSPASNEVELRTPETPEVPDHLRVSSVGVWWADLDWNGSDGATKYLVYRATSIGGPYTEVATPTTPGKTVTGLTTKTTYYFYVQAANLYATSAKSETVTVTTH